MTTQTRECVHSGVAQKTKRLQGQSNLNAWEEPRETHAPAQTNKTPTNQTPNNPVHKNIKKQQPTPHKTHQNNKTKTPKTPIALCSVAGLSAHPPFALHACNYTPVTPPLPPRNRTNHPVPLQSSET